MFWFNLNRIRIDIFGDVEMVLLFTQQNKSPNLRTKVKAENQT